MITSQEIQIHLLLIPYDLEEVELPTKKVEQLFSVNELKQYKRYLVKTKKIEFYLARKFAKELLSSTLNVPVSKIELIPDDYGKPFLAIEGKEIPLYFNLSHTSGLISCVISKHRHTGIDVEAIAGGHEDIVQQFFHPQEICDYRALKHPNKIERFYTLWTLKEAYLKAIGQGLHIPLDSFRFLLSTTDGVISAAIHFDDQQEQEKNHSFQFFLTQPTNRHQLAAAVQTSENTTLRERRYSLTQECSFVRIPQPTQELKST